MRQRGDGNERLIIFQLKLIIDERIKKISNLHLN